MKITALKKNLLDAVVLAEKITGKKESLPVLSCILLEVKKDVTVRATNLESGIEVLVQCEILDEGSIAVSPAILGQTLRSMSGDKVMLYSEEGNLIIESKGSKTLVKSVQHDEFPILSVGDKGKIGVVVARDRFLKGLQSVLYAASPSMIRPELGSVYVATRSNGVFFVATDSFRLAEKNIPGVAVGELHDLLIPMKHVVELVYILEKLVEEKIEVLVEDSQLVVVGDGVRYVSRVVDANFPDYKVIIPKTTTSEVVVLKSDLIDLVRKARVFSGANQHIGLHIYPKKKIFSATARSNEVGEMSDVLEATVSGEDLDINFHIGYIADCLSIISSDSVILAFAGVGKPLVIRGVGDASFMYLVMPLNK